jgi:hypothetical protein
MILLALLAPAAASERSISQAFAAGRSTPGPEHKPSPLLPPPLLPLLPQAPKSAPVTFAVGPLRAQLKGLDAKE